MITDFLNNDINSLIAKLYIVFFTWLVVLIAIAIDLYHGIKKSKSLGEYTHTYGLRQTVQKIINYLSMMLFMLLFDVLNPFSFIEQIQGMPIASMGGAIVLVWIEFKSVREKADQKFRRRTEKATKELLDVILKDENGVMEKIRDNFNKKTEE